MFGRLDLFAKRCRKLAAMFTTIEQFAMLSEVGACTTLAAAVHTSSCCCDLYALTCWSCRACDPGLPIRAAVAASESIAACVRCWRQASTRPGPCMPLFVHARCLMTPLVTARSAACHC